MQRVWEILLGLDRGFLSREGEFALRFYPSWPMADVFGNAAWNLLLVAAAVGLVIWVYRREGKTRPWKVGLGAARLVLLVVLIALLNRPALTLTQTRVESSVLAVLIDDSMSMRVQDIEGQDGSRQSRLEAAVGLLTDDDARLLEQLAERHALRYYRFSRDASPLTGEDPGEALRTLEPVGTSTQVSRAVQNVVRDLQGQNLAGIVLLSDGRDAPARSDAAALAAVKQGGARVYPVPVGGIGEPLNVEVQNVVAQDTAFAGDIVNIVATVRAAGAAEPTPVTLRLRDAEGNPVLDPDGRPVETTATLDPDQPTQVELPLETVFPGTLDMVVEAEAIPGEIDEADNRRPLQVEVLDAEVAVLYVDGYPRWEYSYLRNQLIRDSTVNVSMLLTSADPGFAQEGNTPIQRFPVTIDELLAYDVILLGDVSPQQFSDGQLQLIEEFVGDLGGGLAMVAGPRFSPWSWRGTPIERLLPVDIAADPSAALTGRGGTLTQGYRPVLTEAGRTSGLFRFRMNREDNERFIAEEIQPLFWWADGVIPRPGVGEVLAHHPEATAPDGRPAPLLVAGRYGAGRTVFNAMDETWRWRFYTGEHVFDTFWVQTIRHLARGRKLGERRLTLSVRRPSYELGEQVQVELRLLDPQLSRQLPDRLDAELRNEQGQPVRNITLSRRGEGVEGDRYTGSYTADRVGNFSVHLPAVTGDTDPLSAPVVVEVPQTELHRPVVDRAAMHRLASETGGELFELHEAPERLLAIPSAERRIPILSSRALWDAPLALALFVLVLTLEWVGRKAAGLL